MSPRSLRKQPAAFARSVLLTAVVAIAGCGGGGGGADGTGSPAPMQATTFSSGVMTKGSVIVNGVRFDDGGQVYRAAGRPG